MKTHQKITTKEEIYAVKLVGTGQKASHYQPNRVLNSVVRNESAEPDLSWQKGCFIYGLVFLDG